MAKKETSCKNNQLNVIYAPVYYDKSTKFEIIDCIIRASKEINPSYIYKHTKIKHYPTILYHLDRLTEEGFIIPIGSNYFVPQGFIIHRKTINKHLEKAVESAFKKFTICHFVNGDCSKCDQALRASLFIRCFMYYIQWLLTTGEF